MRLVAAVLVLAAACGTPRYALVDGKRVERPSLGYSDNHHYALQHRRAFPDVFTPGRARVVDDGRISGRACGLEVDVDASWYGPRIELDGRFDVPWIKDFTHTEGLLHLALDVTETAAGRRHIVGQSGFGFDVEVSPERLVGDIGRRHYELAADGAYLVGRMTTVVMRLGHTEEISEPMVIYGRDKLATMPPADEAVVLLTMLSCGGVSLDRDGAKVRGFSLVPLQ